MTRRIPSLALLLGVGLLGLPCSPEAVADGATQVHASFVSVNPSMIGLEGGLSFLFKPFADHELVIGPKATGLVAKGQGLARFDFNSGVDATLWLVNAFGPGLALSIVTPSVISGEGYSTHYRMEPNFQVRFLRFGEDGAWAARVGIPFDTHYKWGIQAGVTLQLSGVPVTGPVQGSE